MSTNKFSKYVIDNIVVGTPISSIVAAGATIGLDSAAVTALIDSDYVQQRETSGLDSAEVIALIDSDYVSSRTPTANGGGLDSAAALDLFAYGIEEVGVNQRQAAISLNTFVDPFNQTGNTDRAFNLNYTSTTGMFIRETGGRTEIHADASGTGQSTGLLLLGASFGNNGTEIVGNLKLSSLPTTDPAETGLLWNDGGIPVFSGSTAPTGGAGLDSAAVISTINDEFKVSSSKVEIGQLANASGGFSVALGYGADATGTASFAIGDATASSSNALAIVDNAVASASLAIAIGQRAEATHINTIALGNEADAKGNYGIAIGDNAAATATDTLAIGKSASASTNNAIDIRTSAAGSLTYDTTNDWTFGAGVTMTDLTASGATVVFSNLPTTDPVNAGQLWNDSGTLKVSAG